MNPKKTEPMETNREKAAQATSRTDSNSDSCEAGTDGRKTGKKHRNMRKWIAVLLCAIGLLLICVPLVITHINARRSEDIIEQFLKEAQQASVEEIVVPSLDETPASDSTVLSATAVSPEPAPSDGDGAEDPSAGGSPSPASTKKPLMSAEEIKQRMTAVLIIDKIKLKMIVMDGVDEETLRVAAGRMPETGNFDEIGNVVLAGHRSYTFGKYFNRLDELEPGDRIVVQTKNKTLEYEVYKKHIIEPDDLSILKQSDSEKILTLFTCHPVMIATHRLVVHARQIN